MLTFVKQLMLASLDSTPVGVVRNQVQRDRRLRASPGFDPILRESLANSDQIQTSSKASSFNCIRAKLMTTSAIGMRPLGSFSSRLEFGIDSPELENAQIEQMLRLLRSKPSDLCAVKGMSAFFQPVGQPCGLLVCPSQDCL